MKMMELMNVVNHPDVMPDYMQRDGKVYCDVNQPDVVWRFFTADEKNWYERISIPERDKGFTEAGQRYIWEYFSKVLVAEVKND